MRIATGICSIGVFLIVALQSCAVGVGGGLGEQEKVKNAGAAGFLVSLTILFAGAFAFKKPKVSMYTLIGAGVMGWIIGTTTEFGDMRVWGSFCFVLAYMSYTATDDETPESDIKQQTSERSSDTQLQNTEATKEFDESVEAIFCTECGQENAESSQYCVNCGQEL